MPASFALPWKPPGPIYVSECHVTFTAHTSSIECVRQSAMGASQVKFEERTLREYEETTPFNRSEIAHAFKLFAGMYHDYHSANRADNIDINVEHIYMGREGFANTEAALPVDYIVQNFPHLKANPLGRRICQAFVVSTNGLMTFTEFLDMVSSMSPKTELAKKVPHAFQIFDLDGDGLISRQDMHDLMDLLTEGEDNWGESLKATPCFHVSSWVLERHKECTARRSTIISSYY